MGQEKPPYMGRLFFCFSILSLIVGFIFLAKPILINVQITTQEGSNSLLRNPSFGEF